MMETDTTPRVLFLCTQNAARSQMAEAFLRHYAGDRFEVLSAGLAPTQVHPLTRQVLTETGLDPRALRAKGLNDFLGRVSIHYAIIVCAQAEADCPRLYPCARFGPIRSSAGGAGQPVPGPLGTSRVSWRRWNSKCCNG